MATSAAQTLIQDVARLQPHRVVCFGNTAFEWFSMSTIQAVVAREPEPASISQQQFDVAILSDLCERPSADAQSLLARCRDLLSRHVFAIVEHHCAAITPTSMTALGFLSIPTDDPEFALFEFHIGAYKQVPDWLNDRHWANPERWDKFRW